MFIRWGFDKNFAGEIGSSAFFFWEEEAFSDTVLYYDFLLKICASSPKYFLILENTALIFRDLCLLHNFDSMTPDL
jgi:hypothetical protein